MNFAKPSLNALLSPASVALVGVSPQEESVGNNMLLELHQSGYEGTVYLVNPKYKEVANVRCYASVSDLPEAPDLTVLAVANSRLESLVDESIARGTKALVLFGSAHLEGDAIASTKLIDRIREMASAAGVAVCGANCMGFYNHDLGLRVFPQYLPRTLAPGHVAYISQSGSALTALLWNNRKLRFNLAVSSGQEIVTTAADYLDYALKMPSTRVVALFMESIRDPDAFSAALEKARLRQIPVVALKVGRTDTSAALALSHTGAIAGNDAVYQALFAKYGVCVVETLDELAATIAIFSLPQRVASGAVAAILDSGGERELLVDVAEKMNVSFAKISEETGRVLGELLDPGLDPINPLDAWGTGKDFEKIFSKCLEALVADPASSLGVLVADLTSGFAVHEAFGRVCGTLAQTSKKPIVLINNHVGTDTQDLAMRLVDQGVCVLDGTKPALTAIKHAINYRDFIGRPVDVLPANVSDDVTMKWRNRLSNGGILDESEGLALLSDYGVTTQRSLVVDSLNDALSAASEMGYPVVLKTAAPGVLHKSDVDGVALNLKNSEALGEAYANISGRLGSRVLVGSMVPGGIEFAVGVLNDKDFGPYVMVAAGGVFIELLKDRSLRLAPFGVSTAREMIDSLVCRPLLDGFRGSVPCNIDHFALTLSRISRLAADLCEFVEEMDVNPLKVTPGYCIAVDALVTASGALRQREAIQHAAST